MTDDLPADVILRACCKGQHLTSALSCHSFVTFDKVMETILGEIDFGKAKLDSLFELIFRPYQMLIVKKGHSMAAMAQLRP